MRAPWAMASRKSVALAGVEAVISDIGNAYSVVGAVSGSLDRLIKKRS